jgi:lipopolysaccharide transport system ATP-binding protein
LREALAGLFQEPKKYFRLSEKLGKSEFWALRNISLKVNKGEVLGVIGSNGAGKSTLLKVLSRITPPTKGEVVLRGRVASLLEVGTGFHQELTGRENVYLNGAILGMSRKQISNKFDEIVDFSGVEKFLDTPIKHYSSGMRLRLAFSVAAHLEPEILLVDEVLSVGDAEFQKKSLGKMEEVSSEGRTVVYISHNLPSILGLCDRAILLKNGAVSESGTPGKVVGKYLGTRPRDVGKIFFEDTGSEVQISSVEIKNTNFKTGIDFQKEIKFQVEVLVKELTSFYLFTSIFNEEGERLILWRDIELDERQKNPKESGRYIYEIVLPSHTLVPGNYIVEIGLSEMNQKRLLHQPQERLNITVIDKLSFRKKYNFSWQSKTAVPLQYTVKKIA